MNLIEENFQQKQENKKKGNKILITTVLVAIVVIVILICAILGYMYYLKESKMILTLNDIENEGFKKILLIEQDGTIYVPIKEAAPYFGYESYNGEYTEKSEDQSKCYVKSENEVVNIALGSEKIYKLDLTTGTTDYEYLYVKKPIKAINGILYASSDTIEQIFNLSFSYDKEANKISIYTVDYLFEQYSKIVLDYGYVGIHELFVNQKAILDGILIVKTEKNEFGVIKLDGTVILEAKYDDIKYLIDTGDFLIRANGKTGIMSQNAQLKVDINYDDIVVIDSDVQLYAVRKDNKYGIMDFKGNIKIYIEYDAVGIDIHQFTSNNIKNKYLLANNLIPVKKEKYWALFDINGKQLTEFKYDDFGCIPSNNRNASNLLVIPDYNVLVASKDKRYTLINSSGKELFAPVAVGIYIEITGGKKYYYIETAENKYNAIDFLEQTGVQASNSSNNNNSNNSGNTTNTNNTTNSTRNNNTNQNTSSEQENNNSEQIDDSNEETNNNNQDENSRENNNQANNNEQQETENDYEDE